MMSFVQSFFCGYAVLGAGIMHRLLYSAVVLAFLITGNAFGQRPSGDPIEAAYECQGYRNQSDDFYSCWLERALPPNQQRNLRCADATDFIDVYIYCIHGIRITPQDEDFIFCAHEFSLYGRREVENCLGRFLRNENEIRLARCVYETQGNLWQAAWCASGRQLSPEQQVIAGCVMQTGGEPKSTIACIGGTLTVREIEKCFSGGIGTSQGCFGPNNDAVRYLRNAWNDVTRGPGPNNDLWRLGRSMWSDMTHGPGPNNDVRRFLDNAQRDLTQGPGPNNEVRRALDGLAGGRCSVIRNPFGRGC